MAEVISINGQEYKRRSPFGVWGLGIITVGIYALVWWYKVNDEARRYLGDDSIRPGMSVLAFVPGFILLVPPYISVYRGGERFGRMQERAGLQKSVSAVLGLIASFFYGLHVPYYQSELNKVWDAAKAQAFTQFPSAPAQPPLAPPPPPPPPADTPPPPPAP